MFYVYRFVKATRDYIVWHLMPCLKPFTSTAQCEEYLKKLGYSLNEICRDFCFRWISGPRRPMLIEPKALALYPELRERKGVKFIGW